MNIEDILDCWLSLHEYNATCYYQFAPHNPQKYNGECDVLYFCRYYNKNRKRYMYNVIREKDIDMELYTPTCEFVDKFTFKKMIDSCCIDSSMSASINITAEKLYEYRKDVDLYNFVWLYKLVVQFLNKYDKLNVQIQHETIKNNLNDLRDMLTKYANDNKIDIGYEDGFVLPKGYCFKKNKNKVQYYYYTASMTSLLVLLFNEQASIMKDYYLCVIFDDIDI